jgi:hypothetical protein
MPREEDLPPSKGGRLAEEKTKESRNFKNFIGPEILFSTLNDKQRVDWLVTYINDCHARYNLIIEDKQDQIDKLNDRLS